MSAANEQGFEVVNAEDAKPDMAEPQDHVEAKGAEKQEEEEEEEVEVEEEVEEEEIEEEEEEGDVEQEIEQEGQEEPQQQAIAEEKAAETSSEQQPSTSGPSAHGTNVSLDELETKAKALLKDGAEAIDKLSSGLRSALGTALGPGDAGNSLSKLAGGLTSGLGSWFSMDTAPKASSRSIDPRIAAAGKASNELQQMFGLGDAEHLVEQFKCKLLQTYACAHNTFTPSIQMAFQGTLYVTDQHVCFSVEEKGRNLPVKVPLSGITSATRQLPSQKGMASDVLKLELGPGKHVAFKDFDSGGALDSALALIEHLIESN